MPLEAMLTEGQAAEIISRKRKLLESVGYLTSEEIEQKLETCRQEFKLYQTAHRLKESGYTCQQISEKIGISYNTLISWTHSGKIPFTLATENYFSPKENRNPKSTSLELAKVLGFISAARSIRPSVRPVFSFVSDDKKVLDQMLPLIVKVFSVKPNLVPGYHQCGWMMRFSSVPAMEYFKEQTLENTVVPWQLLTTPEHKIEFFRGFLLRRGEPWYRLIRNEVLYLKLTMSFLNNPSLGKELGVLLMDLGLFPHYSQEQDLEIPEPAELRKIIDSGWCQAERKRKFLEEKLKKFSPEKNPVNPQFVSDILEKVSQRAIPYKEALQIAKAEGILRGTFYSWVKHGKVPVVVKRYQLLREFSQEIGCREALTYFYQQLGLSVKGARTIARSISPEFWKDLLSGKWGTGRTRINYDFFNQKADILAWYNLAYTGQKLPREEASTAIKDPQFTGLIKLEDLFNLFLPESHLNSREEAQAVYLQLYQHLKAHPSFSQLVSLEKGGIYAFSSRLPLLESYLGYSGFGKMRRKLAEAQQITRKMG